MCVIFLCSSHFFMEVLANVFTLTHCCLYGKVKYTKLKMGICNSYACLFEICIQEITGILYFI